jgi:hypothetical protein
MKTIKQLTKRIAAFKAEGKSECFLGFDIDVYLNYLTFEQARPLLKEGATCEDWGGVKPLTREQVLSDMKDYMTFAWMKVKDHRGNSASRSGSKMRAWLWLLEDEELREYADNHDHWPQYGAPILAAICDKYGFAIPDSSELRNMIEGRPCGVDYPCGCGE